MNLFKLLNYRTCLFTDNHFPLLGLSTKRNWIFTEYFCKAFLALKNSCLELSQKKKKKLSEKDKVSKRVDKRDK